MKRVALTAAALTMLSACVYAPPEARCSDYPDYQRLECEARERADAERDERYDAERRQREGLPPNATPLAPVD